MKKLIITTLLALASIFGFSQHYYPNYPTNWVYYGPTIVWDFHNNVIVINYYWEYQPFYYNTYHNYYYQSYYYVNYSYYQPYYYNNYHNYWYYYKPSHNNCHDKPVNHKEPYQSNDDVYYGHRNSVSNNGNTTSRTPNESNNSYTRPNTPNNTPNNTYIKGEKTPTPNNTYSRPVKAPSRPVYNTSNTYKTPNNTRPTQTKKPTSNTSRSSSSGRK